ncbi:MAG: NADPH:quinone oxidoreductase family protein [Myxococcales bacterium]|nr:NADPH:quinone oxidoreductase family protein [Myxococcales bacterium]
MRAMQIRELGGPEKLEAVELPDPEPGPGQVSVDVAAIGCNFADTLICRGKYQLRPELPFSPGSEVAGRIRALGAGVSGLVPGQRVMAQLGYGGYATVALADARRVHAIPDALSFEQAAAFGVAHQTSYLALVDRAALQPGETLLVHAAAGGVGLSAVQLGHALGARVIAIAGNDDKLALARRHGADEGLLSGTPDWHQEVQKLTGGRGADVIYDSVGGETTQLSTKCIAWGGRLLVIGFSSGEIPSLALNRVMLKHIAVMGVNLGGYHEHQPERLRDAMEQLFSLHTRGVAPEIGGRYPLERAADALAELAARRTTGKLVLLP